MEDEAMDTGKSEGDTRMDGVVVDEVMDSTTPVSGEVSGDEPMSVTPSLTQLIERDDIKELGPYLAIHWPVTVEGYSFDVDNVLSVDHSNTLAMTGGQLLHAVAYHNATNVARHALVRGANANAQSKCGLWTPLLVACARGSYEVAEYLIDHQADVNVQLPLSKERIIAPLHLAILSGSEPLLNRLLVEGAHVTWTDKQSTALHFSMEVHSPSLTIVKQLVESGALASTKDKNGKTAGDLAAARGLHDIADYLRGVKNLEAKWRSVKKNEVLVHVRGQTGGGKSALIDSFKVTSITSSLFRSENQASSTSAAGTNTPAIRVLLNADSKSGINLKLVEFADQARLGTVHSRFHLRHTGGTAPYMALFVVPAHQGFEDMQQALNELCSEYAALHRTKPISEDSMPRIIVVCSHTDSSTLPDRMRCNAIYTLLKKTFGGRLRFHSDVVHVDARKSRKTSALRDLLVETAKDLLKMSQAFTLADDVIRHLPSIKQQLGQAVVSLSDFLEVATTTMRSKAGDELLRDLIWQQRHKIIEHLMDHLEIEYVPVRELVILDTDSVWAGVVDRLVTKRDDSMSETDVRRYIDDHPVKPLPGAYNYNNPPNETVYKSVFSDVPLADVDTALQEFLEVPPGEAAHVALHLVGGIQIKDSLRFFDPAGSQHEDYRIGRWPYDPAYKRFAGRRFTVKDGGVFSLAFATDILGRVSQYFLGSSGGHELIVFLDGVAGRARGGDAEGALVMTAERRYVDVVVRSRSDNLRQMYALLQVLCRIVRTGIRDRSPGSQMEEGVLSCRAISLHVQYNPEERPRVRMPIKHCYTLLEVDAALERNDVLFDRVMCNSDLPLDTLHLPEDHLLLMSRKTGVELLGVLQKQPDMWQRLGQLLGITEKQMQLIERAYSDDPLSECLRIWASRGVHHTIPQLVHVLEGANSTAMWDKVIALLQADLHKSFVGLETLFDALPAPTTSVDGVSETK